MKTTLTGTAALLYIVMSITTAADALASDHTAASEVDATLSKLIADYEAKDVRAIMAHYVHDDALVVFDVTPPLQFVGYDAYTKSYQDFYAAFPGQVTVDVIERKISVVGELAYTHEMNTWTVHDQTNKPTMFTARETYVLQKTEGKWLIVHEHASVPVDVTTGRAELRLTP